MKTFEIEVTQVVKVTVDETKFTKEFMKEFREVFYDFQSINDHAEHLAQLYARGLVTPFTSFIEGYGEPENFGIDLNVVDTEIEILTGRV